MEGVAVKSTEIASIPRSMTEEEFEAWCDEDVRAEYVDGEVIVHTPVSTRYNDVMWFLGTLLNMFVSHHGLGRVYGPELQVRLRPGLRRVPDLLFVAKARTEIIHERHVEGAPDLVIEIVSPDSVVRDWREKYFEYEAAGVQEYWVIVEAVNLTRYKVGGEGALPLIVIIIDELADLMMVASKDVEASVARLAQMARAAGMHMILATQRPSVDVLTGLIKANFPTRISFKVSSKIDSRTILDQSGAEHLLGKGDMLFMPPGASRLQRIHCAYVSEAEIAKIVSFLKEQRRADYDESVLRIADEDESGGGGGDEEYDEKYDEAVEFVCESGQASISMVQRRLRVGYNRAARMIETMEREGIVGPADGAKPREVLVRKKYS